MKIFCKYYLLFLLLTNCCSTCLSQVTIPWSSILNISFGEGSVNPGSPLNIGRSDFAFTSNPCPTHGNYTVANKVNCAGSLEYDAGHFFLGAFPFMLDTGYMMVVSFAASPEPQIVFEDTLQNLCEGQDYLFWAALKNITSGGCVSPNLSLSVETLSGQIIKSFATGTLDGPDDKGTWYPGYWDALPPPPKPPNFPYYGGRFTLPPGVSNIVVKIIENASGANNDCTGMFAIDNILVSALGPAITISDPKNEEAWITSACFTGNTPVILKGNIAAGYKEFGTSNFIYSSFKDVAVEWQQSFDNGFTWSDITGETQLTFSKQFTKPDTFLVRMKASEKANLGNENCSIFSNVIQVQIDGPPKDFGIQSNSPVCTDGDLQFILQGGSSYTITGPNGYFDNIPTPHIYHPVPADSGWYYANIITQGGCFITDSTNVQIIGPSANISPEEASVCYGKSVQLLASGGDIYSWSPSQGLSDVNVSNPLAATLTTTKYQVKVTDQSGCSAYKSITVQLRDSILKAIFNSPPIVCPNDIVLMKDTSEGNIVKWEWNFGNGQTSSLKDPPPQNYPSGGSEETFFVTLTVTDTANCTDTAFNIIRSENNCYIAVPSAFTPNGDGVNDYLYPLNAYKATALNFIVYNRFGQLVFQTKDWTKKWNGKVNDESQPQGTYIWILSYTNENNKKVFLKGTTVLIR